MNIVIISGLLLGMASSLHCIGMCGPLGLSIPGGNTNSMRGIVSFSIYHFGRIMTYAMFGLIFGLAGRGIYLAGFQQITSIIIGILMIGNFLFHFFFRNFLASSIPDGLMKRIQSLFTAVWAYQGISKFFLLGIINGMLPCGMVYLALALAFTTKTLSGAVLVMTMFGLGTLPALAGLRYFAFSLSMPMRNYFKRISPLLIGIMGLMLILRGLNLGIPYLSPAMVHSPASAVFCH
jgi:sulfite exporter TauE/SafE